MAATEATAAIPLMDREFIARNQIVERYLSGRLPAKGVVCVRTNRRALAKKARSKAEAPPSGCSPCT